MACVLPNRLSKLSPETLSGAPEGLRLRIACALAYDPPRTEIVGDVAKRLMLIFSEAMKDKEAARRRDAAFALGKLRPFLAAEVTPLLKAALDDDDRDVRHLAAAGLGESGGGEKK
jgi:HEAT repeat protein